MVSSWTYSKPNSTSCELLDGGKIETSLRLFPLLQTGLCLFLSNVLGISEGLLVTLGVRLKDLEHRQAWDEVSTEYLLAQ